jgi:hypothetical protein
MAGATPATGEIGSRMDPSDPVGLPAGGCAEGSGKIRDPGCDGAVSTSFKILHESD